MLPVGLVCTRQQSVSSGRTGRRPRCPRDFMPETLRPTAWATSVWVCPPRSTALTAERYGSASWSTRGRRHPARPRWGARGAAGARAPAGPRGGGWRVVGDGPGGGPRRPEVVGFEPTLAAAAAAASAVVVD